MGQIITFYSYKGGVGRSMALANVAVLLAQWGFKTLVIDWDLEAPGLELYFRKYLSESRSRQRKGITDLLYEYQMSDSKAQLDWHDLVAKVALPNSVGQLHIICAGKQDKNYFRRVRAFDIDTFYTDHNGGEFVERLRREWRQLYDFVLVDSRTGVTDIGGICTVQLPDLIVMIVVANEQNSAGILEVIRRIKEARQRLIQPRFNLIFIPVPSRFDNSEYEQSQNWLERFSKDFGDVYKNWLPEKTSLSNNLGFQLLDLMKLPYVAYFSYGEKLAVLETRRSDTTGLGYAYETLASVLANEVENVVELIETRDKYITQAKRRAREHTAANDKTSSKRLFISYANQDSDWYEKVLLHLKPALDSAEITGWGDAVIQPGEDWRSSLQRAIQSSDVILLLASSNYLASIYIQEQELPYLLRRAERDGARVIWLALNHFPYRESQLGEFQSVNDPQKPLAELSPREQEKVLVDVTRKIVSFLKD